MPLAFMMGVSFEDSFIVAELIGIKTVLNELLAYQKMSKIIKLRNAGGPEYVDNVKQYISVSLVMHNCTGFSKVQCFFVPVFATDLIVLISFWRFTLK